MKLLKKIFEVVITIIMMPILGVIFYLCAKADNEAREKDKKQCGQE